MATAAGNPELVFVFMDQLPTIRDCVISITNYSAKRGSTKQNYAVQKFAQAVELQWQKAFTSEHVITIRHIKKKLNKVLQSYTNQVLKKAKKERRMNYTKWRKEAAELFDLLKQGSNPDEFDPDERAFYYDQKNGIRKMALSDQIDQAHEDDVEVQKKQVSDQQQLVEAEMAFIEAGVLLFEQSADDNDDEATENDLVTDLNISFTRSGCTRPTVSTIDDSSQTDHVSFGSIVPLRVGSRNFDPKIKTALASASSQAGITTEQARQAFQVTSEVFYGMKYFLSADEHNEEPVSEVDERSEYMQFISWIWNLKKLVQGHEKNPALWAGGPFKKGRWVGYCFSFFYSLSFLWTLNLA